MESSNVGPQLSLNDEVDDPMAYSIFASESNGTVIAGMPARDISRSDFPYLVIGELGKKLVSTLHGSLAGFMKHIQSVLKVITKKEVGRVAAARIIAGMTNLLVNRSKAERYLISHATGNIHSMACLEVAYMK